MEKYQQVEKGFKKIIINNFFGGIAWGIGATFGASIIIAFLGLILSRLNLIPVIGTFVADITNFVLQSNPHLLK